MGTQNNVLWSVSLSNGETIHEEKGEYKTIPGELSPWQRLVSYIGRNGLSITSLSLYTKEGRRFSLPSAGKDPRFKAFAEAEKPTSYRMFRKMGGDIMNGQVKAQDNFTVAQATYSDGRIMEIWVDNHTLNSWVLMSKNI